MLNSLINCIFAALIYFTRQVQLLLELNYGFRLESSSFSSGSQMAPSLQRTSSRAHRGFQILPLHTWFRIADKSAFEGDGVTVVGLSYHRSFGEGRFNTVFRYGCLIAYVSTNDRHVENCSYTSMLAYSILSLQRLT